MQRSLSPLIQKDVDNKIILLSGPRQSGKTTLTKQLFQSYDYLNFDSGEDRERILKKHWNRSVEAVIFDELHKMPDWKRWLKGIYDTEELRPRMIVTGSAQFETLRKVGDSLAGRFFSYHMHPVDIKEGFLNWNQDPAQVLERLMTCSGFPEPFLKGDPDFYRRWQTSHLDVILRQDFLDLYSVRHIKILEILIGLMKQKVGSSTNYASLARDLQVDHKTVKSWLECLENIYALFHITPYHHHIARSLLKEPKFYFYDVMRAPSIGARLENIVACCLLKEIDFLKDQKGYQTSLHYLKTKDGHEIDFCICIDNQILIAIEVKTSNHDVSKSFYTFRESLKGAAQIQLVTNLEREYSTPNGIRVCNLANFLSTFQLEDYLRTWSADQVKILS